MTTETKTIPGTDKYLAQMLEGYEKALPDIKEFIKNTKEQLEGAGERLLEIEGSIAELKELLDVTEEE